MDTILLPSQETLVGLCRKWRVQELSPFGSLARGDARPDSDADLLVTFEANAPWSAFELIDMRADFAELFGRRVDLVEEALLRNPYRKASILKDKTPIYVA